LSNLLHHKIKEQRVVTLFTLYITNFGFSKQRGFEEEKDLQEIHFEKVYSPYYQQKGGVSFDSLERGKLLLFEKNDVLGNFLLQLKNKSSLKEDYL